MPSPSSSSSSASSDEITLQTRGKIAIITLNRASKLNALDMKLYYRLACLMREVAAREDIFITVLTGKGRYFSAGVNVTSIPSPPSSSSSTSSTSSSSADSPQPTQTVREQVLRSFVANNLDITHAFYTHPKILITALNGPAIGLSAALIAFSDFIYAAPHAFLLTPFTSLGLVAEGGASRAFVQRLGISKANEALIMSKKISAEEMLRLGFVNRIFETEVPKGSTKSKSTQSKKEEDASEASASEDQSEECFLNRVLAEIHETLGDHLNAESMVQVKALIRRPDLETMGGQTVAEVLAGLARFETGVPQEEFRKVASGEKRHKL